MENSLSKTVAQAIENHPYIKYAVGEGIVNYSALARKFAPFLEKKLNKKINEESLIVAIKRYSDKHSSSSLGEIRDLIGQSSLSMQDGVSYAVIKRTPETFEAVDTLFEEVDWGFNEIRTVVGSASHLVVLLGSSRMDDLLEKVEDSFVEVADRDKAIVTVKLPREAFEAHGVLHEMTSVLAKNGVSINLFCFPPEIHFIVDEKDSEKTYKILRDLVKESKNNAESEYAVRKTAST